jgi:CO dehydrogenase nickel-insertion accessory protein CooC1
MSITVVGGAGADGKTTVLELVSKHLVAKGREPLVIDANPDQNIASFFGMSSCAEEKMLNICEHWEDIRDALEGDNPDYPNKDFIVDTSPLTQGSVRWDAANPNDPILSKYSRLHDGVRFMRTGTYEVSDIGAGCLHDKIGALTFMLNHMNDGADGTKRMTFVDNAHGRDAFGTPLYAQGDVIMVVARPEKKSLDIMLDYLKMAKQVEEDIQHPINIVVVGNRFSADPEIFKAQEKIFKELAGEHFIAALQNDEALERGLNAELAGLIRDGFNVAAANGGDILSRVHMTNKGPELTALNEHNKKAIEQIASIISAAPRVPERKKQWIELCLGRAEYLDKLIDPSVRQQKSEFVADKKDAHSSCGHSGCGGHHHHHHRHGPGCKH